LDQYLREHLKTAINLSLSGDWNAAHQIVQEYKDPISSWIHGVLHKIEGDEFNSRYWYARTSAEYEDFHSVKDELIHLLTMLDKI
jgi:hypothetical protein